MTSYNRITGSLPSIPTFVANGLAGSGANRFLTFNGTYDPPDGPDYNGEIGLVFISLAISDVGWADNAEQRLFYFSGRSNSHVPIINNSADQTFSTVALSGFTAVGET